jgi:hypothetical protein
MYFILFHDSIFPTTIYANGPRGTISRIINSFVSLNETPVYWGFYLFCVDFQLE